LYFVQCIERKGDKSGMNKLTWDICHPLAQKLLSEIFK
jgi:hypothetical protein